MHRWWESLDADLSALQSGSLNADALALHGEIVRQIHRWKRGDLAEAHIVDALISAVESMPRVHMLDTVAAWRRQFIEVIDSDQIIERLSESRHALARVYAAFEWRDEPETPVQQARFLRLLGDRSQRVRRRMVETAWMSRWYSALPHLQARQTAECDDEIGHAIAVAAAMIPSGHYLEGDWAQFYWGPHPGGAHWIGGVRLSEVTVAQLKELGRRELTYRLKYGRWPERPSDYFERIERLLDWDPN